MPRTTLFVMSSSDRIERIWPVGFPPLSSSATRCGRSWPKPLPTSFRTQDRLGALVRAGLSAAGSGEEAPHAARVRTGSGREVVRGERAFIGSSCMKNVGGVLGALLRGDFGRTDRERAHALDLGRCARVWKGGSSLPTALPRSTRIDREGAANIRTGAIRDTAQAEVDARTSLAGTRADPTDGPGGPRPASRATSLARAPQLACRGCAACPPSSRKAAP